MCDTTGKQSVRITLLHSGLSPPIFILSNFTNPPWEPHEMKYAEERVADRNDPSLGRVEHVFWRRFDIHPGVWKYKYRIGHNYWPIYDYLAESGKEFQTRSAKPKLMCSLQREIAQAKSTMSLESRKGGPQSFRHPEYFRSLEANRPQARTLAKYLPWIRVHCPGKATERIFQNIWTADGEVFPGHFPLKNLSC